MIERFMFLDFCNDRDRGAAFLHLTARIDNVFAVTHKRQSNQIYFLLDAERKILLIASSERAHIQTAARKVNTFVRPQNSSEDNLAGHFSGTDFDRFELDLAISEQNRIAFLYRAGQTFVVDGNRQLRTENLPGSEDERAPRRQAYPVGSNRSETKLGSGQILQDRHRFVEPTGDLADVLNYLFVKRVVAVAKVQARHIHTGLNEAFKDFS